MKRLIFLPLIALVLGCYSQSVKISALPADAVLDSNDYFLENHQATTTSKMAGITIMDYAYGVGDSVRGELADTAAALRGEITGAAGWTKSGTHIYATSTSDSLGIGTATPTEKLHVDGNGLIDSLTADDLVSNSATIGDPIDGGQLTIANDVDMNSYQLNWMNLSTIWEVGTQLYFYSPTSGTYGLNDLATAYTYYNGLSKVGNNVKWEGTLNETTDINMGNYSINFESSGLGLLVVDNLATENGWLMQPTTDRLVFGNTGDDYDTISISDQLYFIAHATTPTISVGANDVLTLTTSGSGYVSTQDLAVADTFNIGSTGFIYQYNNSNIFFSPSGNTTISKQPFFATNSEPVGVTLGGIDALKLNYDDYMKSFRNDSTRTAYDDSTAWSASAIRDYVSVNGGSLNVNGSITENQLIIAYDADEIQAAQSTDTIHLFTNSDIHLWDVAGMAVIGNDDYYSFKFDGDAGYFYTLSTDDAYSGGAVFTDHVGGYNAAGTNPGITFDIDSAYTQRPFAFQDTVGFNEISFFRDSAYLKYISGTESTFVTLTPTRALDSASISGAYFAIKYRDYIPPFMDYYNDIKNNERWWYFGFKDGKWITKRGMNLNNPSSLTALQAKSEMQDEWMMQLFNHDDALLDRIQFLEQENASQRNAILDLKEQMKFLADEIKILKKLK